MTYLDAYNPCFYLSNLEAYLLLDHFSISHLRRSRLISPLLRHHRTLFNRQRHQPSLTLLILLFLALECIRPHFGISPRRARVVPLGDVSQTIPMRNKDNLLLGPFPQPLSVPARAGLEGCGVAGVESLFGRPVGREEAEVESGVFGIGF